MNNIKIDENTRMLIEDNNYTLEYRVPKGEFMGKKAVGFKWVLGGYFPTLDTLLQDYIKNAPSHPNASDLPVRNLKEVVDCIQRAEKRVEELIHNIEIDAI